MKNYDAASVPLFKSLLAGSHIANGVLTANKAGAAPTAARPFLKVNSHGAIRDLPSSPADQARFPPRASPSATPRFKVEYSKQNEQGVLAAAGMVSYDVKQNKLS